MDRQVEMEIRITQWDDRRMPRPKTGQTPVRSIRVPDGVWNPAKAKAEGEGRTIGDVITGFLHRYIDAPPAAGAGTQPPADRGPSDKNEA